MEKKYTIKQEEYDERRKRKYKMDFIYCKSNKSTLYSASSIHIKVKRTSMIHACSSHLH